MIDLKGISPVLENIAKLCGIEFQLYHHERPSLSTTSFCAGISEADKQVALTRFALHAKPFQVALLPNGVTLCGMPLNNCQGIRSWLLALVPDDRQGRIEEDVMPLLRSLVETIKDRQADKHELDELAIALDHSFEELALYRRIQKSFNTGMLSSSEISDISTRLRDILQVDLVFGHFPETPDFDVTVTDPGFKERVDIETFIPNLINSILKMKETIDDNHFIVNNSLNDPIFSPLCQRPFRLMVTRAVHNDHTHGWVGAVSFNYYAFFKRSHLNMLQAAASQCALAGANNHLLKGLEGLTTQVKTFKQEMTTYPDPCSTAAGPGNHHTGEFLDSAFNNLSKSIAATKTLMMRSAQMATMGQMAAVFAHEIKQPICALDGFIQIARLKQSDQGQGDDLNMMAKAVRRINLIIKRFEAFSQPHESELKSVSLNSIAREVYQLVTPQLNLKNIDGSFQRANDLPEIMGDAHSLQQAVLNLASNAIGAMESNNGSGSQLQLTTYRKGRHACLDVIDNGQGIAEDLIGKVTEPYVTTKSADKGTGLGLSVVADIVEQHNGRLEIESTPLVGSRFTISIPVPTGLRDEL